MEKITTLKVNNSRAPLIVERYKANTFGEKEQPKLKLQLLKVKSIKTKKGVKNAHQNLPNLAPLTSHPSFFHSCYFILVQKSILFQ